MKNTLRRVLLALPFVLTALPAWADDAAKVG